MNYQHKQLKGKQLFNENNSYFNIAFIFPPEIALFTISGLLKCYLFLNHVMNNQIYINHQYFLHFTENCHLKFSI